jgi:hypothetical protein
LLRLSLRRGSNVFFGYFSIRPGTAQIEKLQFEKSNHLHFGRKVTPLKNTLMAMIVFLVFIVVAAVGIKLAVMRVCGNREDE